MTVLQFKENLINNQDSHSKIENDKTPGTKYLNNFDSKEEETNKTSATPNFILQILLDDEFPEGINYLNSK